MVKKKKGLQRKRAKIINKNGHIFDIHLAMCLFLKSNLLICPIFYHTLYGYVHIHIYIYREIYRHKTSYYCSHQSIFNISKII